MKETNIPALMEKNNANVIETVNNRLSLLESYVKLKKIYVYTHTKVRGRVSHGVNKIF